MTHFINEKEEQEKLYYLPYHWMMRGYLRVSMEFRNMLVIECLSYRHRHSILDLGCGDGYFTAQLKERFPEASVVGADYYLRALRFARIMTSNIPYVATSAASLGFKENCFDAIFVLDVIEHLCKDDRAKAFNQIVAMLKPGGMAIITTPSIKLPKIPMHYDHFDVSDFRVLMEKYFTDVEIAGCNLYLPIIHNLSRFPIIWRIIYFTIRKCDPNQAVTLVGYGKKNN